MTRAHLDALVRAGASDEIWRWLPLRPRTRADLEHWLDAALLQQETGGALPFATIDRATGDLVGSTRYLHIDLHNRRLEIGWTWITPRAQRTSINTEAKYLQLLHAFETLECLRVELRTDVRNERSRAAIARIGATQEGIMRRHQQTQGAFQRDTALFSIIADEWPAVKQRLEAMLERR